MAKYKGLSALYKNAFLFFSAIVFRDIFNNIFDGVIFEILIQNRKNENINIFGKKFKLNNILKIIYHLIVFIVLYRVYISLYHEDVF